MASPARNLPPLNPDDPVQAVRRFNRFYTRQIGVLQEHLLESQLSLTEVRVLYELAHRANLTAIELRQELGLDRGYLSRMLQNFEKQSWIKTTASPSDRRRIMLALTIKGKRIFAPLDQRSSKEVAVMLSRHSALRQKELLGAMHTIEDILTPAPKSHNPNLPTLQRTRKDGAAPSEPQGLKPAITMNSNGTTGSRALPERPLRSAATLEPAYILRQHRPGDMGWVVQRHGELYWNEYRYDEGFEALVAEIVSEFIQNFDPECEHCWIAEKDGERVGTICLVKKSKTIAKLRLLLVEPTARGLGIGKRLVSQCVKFAQNAGYKKIILWTQSELHAARHLYQQAGFRKSEQKPHQSWGRKDLVAETWELKL